MLTLSKYDLCLLWATGLLNDTAYVVLLLRWQYQNDWKSRPGSVGNSIVLDNADIDYLIEAWVAYNGEKQKVLKRSAIVSAVEKIAKGMDIETRYEQISLLSADAFLGIAEAPPLLSGGFDNA